MSILHVSTLHVVSLAGREQTHDITRPYTRQLNSTKYKPPLSLET